MEVACSDPTIKDNDIKKIYFCKSYLQVKWISDLCTADGSNVLKSVKDGIRSIRQSSSRCEEVVQERPGSYIWTIWRNFLRKHICTSRWKTTVQLGDWRISANDSDRLWPFYYSQQEDVLYRSYRTHWHSHTAYEYVAMRGDHPDVYAFEVPHKVCHKVRALPPDAVPCDVEDLDHGWRILDHQPLTLPSISPSSHYDLKSYIRTQPDFISQYYHMIDLLTPDSCF